MADDFFKCTKWNGREESWLSWKREFSTKASLRKLAKFLDIENKPVAPNEKKNGGKDLEDFLDKNSTLYYLIQSAVSDNVAQYLRAKRVAVGDGMASWECLVSQNERADALRASKLRIELGRLAMENDSLDVESYIITLHSLMDQLDLAEGGNAVPQPTAISTLFAGLSAPFRQWVHSYTGKDLKKLSLVDLEEEVKTIARWERGQLQRRLDAEESQSALHTHGSFGRGQHPFQPRGQRGNHQNQRETPSNRGQPQQHPSRRGHHPSGSPHRGQQRGQRGSQHHRGQGRGYQQHKKSEEGCYICGKYDHFCRECPQRPALAHTVDTDESSTKPRSTSQNQGQIEPQLSSYQQLSSSRRQCQEGLNLDSPDFSYMVQLVPNSSPQYNNSLTLHSNNTPSYLPIAKEPLVSSGWPKSDHYGEAVDFPARITPMHEGPSSLSPKLLHSSSVSDRDTSSLFMPRSSVSVPDEPRVNTLTLGGTDTSSLLEHKNIALGVHRRQTEPSSLWILDSGCTVHMCNNKDLFATWEDQIQRREVTVANGHKATIIGSGSVVLTTKNTSEKVVELTLHTVLCVPALSHNLISATQLQREHGIECPQGDNITLISVFGDKRSQIKLCVENGLPTLHSTHRTEGAFFTTTPVDLHTWHRRLGHVNEEMIRKLSSTVTGMHLGQERGHSCENCEVCVAAKMHKSPFEGSTRRATKPLELVHTDIAGPMRVPSAFNGHHYVINFVDDFSRHIKVYTIKHKSDAFQKL